MYELCEKKYIKQFVGANCMQGVTKLNSNLNSKIGNYI